MFARRSRIKDAGGTARLFGEESAPKMCGKSY
jgi:hypothetical protein